MMQNFVLTFHKVLSQKWFKDVINVVSSKYKFISSQDIEKYYYSNKKIKKCCHLCFDDGDNSFYDYAFPVLKQMNIPATLFVSPQIITDSSNYWFQDLESALLQGHGSLLREEIAEVTGWHRTQSDRYGVIALFKSMKASLRQEVLDRIRAKSVVETKTKLNITKEQFSQVCASGLITCGGHTLTHPILSNETDEVAEEEIGKSIEKLSFLSGKDISYFAYPNGITDLDYGNREIEILKKYNVKLAFSTDKGFFNKRNDPFSIPRFALAGIPKENRVWITGKIFLLPIWDGLRDMLLRNKYEMVEKKQRIQIRKTFANSYVLQ